MSTVHVRPDIWIQEPSTGAFIYGCGNSRGIDPMDGITVTWGKTDVMASPPAAVARFTLKDPTNYWVDRLKNRSVIGRTVALNAVPDDGNAEWFFFRGRITGMEVTRGPINPITGTPAHFLLDFTAADVTADFGNIIMPADWTWPAETMLDRAIAIRNHSIPSTGIADFFFDALDVSHGVSPLDVGGMSIQELADLFYRSEGYSWSYLPSQNTVRHQRRQGNVGVTGPEGYYFLDDRGKIIYRPASIAYTDETYGTVTYRGMYLNACKLTADFQRMYTPEGAGINRVECDYYEEPGYAKTTLVTQAPGHDVTDGYRTLKYDSMLSHSTYVGEANDLLYGMANEEASEAQHPVVTYDTELTDGFDNIQDARNLVEAGVKPYRVTIGGSLWCSWMNETPNMFQIIGGTMRFVDGRWVFDLNLNTLRRDAHESATYASISEYLKWGDVGNQYELAPELTWSDSRWFSQDSTLYAQPTTP